MERILVVKKERRARNSDSEIVKYIMMNYLSEKTYIKDEIEKG
jgi:hypothetical protein